MHGLTQCYIIDRTRIFPVLLGKKELVKDFHSPYFLLIYSTIPHSIKITVYPVHELPVVKYLMGGMKITESTVEKMLGFLQNYHPIILHTSGIVYKETRYEYEIYFTDIKETFLMEFRKNIKNLPGIEYLEEIMVPFEK